MDGFTNFFRFSQRLNNFVMKSLGNFEIDNLSYFSKEIFQELENLSKTLKKKIFDSFWMENISIANFMHVEYFSLSKISHDITFKDIFTQSFLSLNIMLAAAIYFMISTEQRLICVSSNDMNGNNQFKIKPVFERTHYEKVKKMKKFIFSEKLHDVSIKLLQNHFKVNRFISHLISSFIENYEKKFEMELIVS